MGKLDWRAVGVATGSFLAVSYLICVAYDLAFDQRMYEAWLKLLPGFTWLTWPSFFLGLVESFLYGIYIGLVFVPLYNYSTDVFSRGKQGGAR
ncbi:MAG: DUF5676 family membrane protein [Betaproteobacteria bacterium]|nr:DUF5676 family membrane protein [Betaproteobacteria bacterium]